MAQASDHTAVSVAKNQRLRRHVGQGRDCATPCIGRLGKEEAGKCGRVVPSRLFKRSNRKHCMDMGPAQKRKLEDTFTEAKKRQNMMITTRLRERACGSEVVIATYHMPCMFYAPKVPLHGSHACDPPVPDTSLSLCL